MPDGIVILGAGIAGLSPALPLARAGRPVTVIDPLLFTTVEVPLNVSP